MTVQAPGTQTRSFCYVSDMVSLHTLSLQVLVCDLTGRTNLRQLEWHEREWKATFWRILLILSGFLQFDFTWQCPTNISKIGYNVQIGFHG